MPKVIQVEVKTSFGRELIYPVCDKAKLFTELTKTETLSPDALEVIKSLGYEFDIVVNSRLFGTIGAKPGEFNAY